MVQGHVKLNQNGWGGLSPLGFGGGRFPNFEIHPYDIWIPDLWRPSILYRPSSRPQGLAAVCLERCRLGCKVHKFWNWLFVLTVLVPCVYVVLLKGLPTGPLRVKKVGTPSGCDSCHERDDIWKARTKLKTETPSKTVVTWVVMNLTSGRVVGNSVHLLRGWHWLWVTAGGMCSNFLILGAKLSTQTSWKIKIEMM